MFCSQDIFFFDFASGLPIWLYNITHAEAWSLRILKHPHHLVAKHEIALGFSLDCRWLNSVSVSSLSPSDRCKVSTNPVICNPAHDHLAKEPCLWPPQPLQLVTSELASWGLWMQLFCRRRTHWGVSSSIWVPQRREKASCRNREIERERYLCPSR